jgi:nitrogen fixation NifU-like protein
MNEVLELYQEIILDHSKSPKNFGHLSNKTHQALGKNPLCGDVISIELVIKDGYIVDIAFVGEGCAISKASASLMTDFLKEKSFLQALTLFENFQVMMIADDELSNDNLGKLIVLKGVKQFPMRVKCATLPWHTLKAALYNVIEEVTTEE